MASVIQKTARNGKMKVNGVELYYEVHGEGDPIILIHGWNALSGYWKSVIDFFWNSHKVIAYDIRGYGNSDKPRRGEYTIQAFADDLYAFMHGLKLDKGTIVGHSMGGMVALVFALDHPEMVSKLVLIDTAAKGDKRMYYRTWLFTHLLYKMTMRMMVNRETRGKRSEQEKEAAFKMMTTAPKYASLKTFKYINTKFDVSGKLSRIKAPTLIIVGENDSFQPVVNSQLLSRGINGSKLVIIPNAGHMTIMGNSGEVNQAIEEFIK